MGQCQVKIIFQNNLLTVLNKHLRLDKLHGFCLITFLQLILFYCQCVTSIEAQTDQASWFLLCRLNWDGQASSTPCRAQLSPAGLWIKRGTPRAGREPRLTRPHPRGHDCGLCVLGGGGSSLPSGAQGQQGCQRACPADG